jgi:uncharacterized protein YbcI
MALISKTASHVLREYTGRAPTKAQAAISGDLVVIVMADALSNGERKLVEHGMAHHVLHTRWDLQRVMGEDLASLVEEFTGRKVLAFMSDNHVEPDVVVGVFVLAPMAEDHAEAELGGERGMHG